MIPPDDFRARYHDESRIPSKRRSQISNVRSARLGSGPVRSRIWKKIPAGMSQVEAKRLYQDLQTSHLDDF